MSKYSYSLKSGPPEFYYLVGEIEPGWVLRRPMKIWVDRDDEGEYVATNDQMSVFGVGKEWSDAIDDYVASLIDYYELIEREAADHQPTAFHLRRIQHYITRASV